VTLVISGWAAVDLLLGAAGAFAATRHGAVPVIAFGLAVPLVAGLWLMTRAGAVRELVGAIPVRWLVAVQSYRVLGFVFVAAWALGRMPWQFALPAGIGDVAVGLAAPLVALSGDRRAAAAWNVAGIADLVVAVTLGFLTSPSPFQQLASNDPNRLITRLPFVLIPTFAVPLSILLHVAALRGLRSQGYASERVLGPASGPARMNPFAPPA
jgi:hypothetical protein